MDAELLGTLGGQTSEGLGDLGAGHAVLGVAGVVHDLETLPGLAQGEHAAGIVAAADPLGNLPDGLLQVVHHRQVIQEIDHGEIVQVDDGPQLVRQLELFGRGVIGGEHDVLTGDAAFFGHQQLCQGGTVTAAAFFLQNFQDSRGRSGLHGEVLPVAGIPGESSLQAAGVLPDALFVIDMERGGILGGDGLQLILCHKRRFHGRRPQIFSVWDGPDGPKLCSILRVFSPHVKKNGEKWQTARDFLLKERQFCHDLEQNTLFLQKNSPCFPMGIILE